MVGLFEPPELKQGLWTSWQVAYIKALYHVCSYSTTTSRVLFMIKRKEKDTLDEPTLTQAKNAQGVSHVSLRLHTRALHPVYRLWYRRTSNHWIVLGEKLSVYRGTRGSRRSACGPNENLKERLSFWRYYPASLVIFVLMVFANCEIKIQILEIQY